MVNWRRSQISAVDHWVLITTPGVPAEPNPPTPSFQEEASNSAWNQASSGWSVVYFQLERPNRASARMTLAGATKAEPRLAAARTAGSILVTARSYVRRPLHSVSTSVVWV